MLLTQSGSRGDEKGWMNQGYILEEMIGLDGRLEVGGWFCNADEKCQVSS